MPRNCLSYPVEFVEDVFGENDVLAKFVAGRKILLVADQNVVQHTEGLGTRIGAYIKNHALVLAGTPIVMPGGERLKNDNGQFAFRVLEACAEAKLGKDDVIVSLGGGSILDAAGWVAAQYLGGVPLVRIPTTPAAMIEAGFAETASLDARNVKDALSVPSVPLAVLIDAAFASSVLEGVWRAGFGEAVRLAAAFDPKMLKKLEPLAEEYAKRNLEMLGKILELTVPLRKKKGYTDYGLALTRELEPQTVWKLPHGHAVPLGVMHEILKEVDLGTRDREEAIRIWNLLKSSGALDGGMHSRHIQVVERIFKAFEG